MSQVLRLLDLPADRMDGDVVGVLFFEDERPLEGPAALLDWRMNGFLTRRLLSGQASGRRNERILVDSNAKILAPWVLFQGAGKLKDDNRDLWRRAVNELLRTAVDAGFSRVAICLGPDRRASAEDMVRLVREELGHFKGRDIECLLSVEERGRRHSDTGTHAAKDPDINDPD
ncbi:MAG: M17 family peptidase N-terminal domain-containing protein [Desulfuromonadales bacterium]